MTKLSITLAIASLTVSLAPAVQAYGQLPEATPQVTSVAQHVNVLFTSAEKAQDGQCSVGVDPALVTVLGLDKPLQSYVENDVALACHRK